MHLARPMRVTFHKAIDVCADPLAVLRDCIALGIDYVLTSGAAATVMEGAEMIRKMVDIANNESGGRTKILAGGGVTAANVAELIERTGVHEVHGSGGSQSGRRFEKLFLCRHFTPYHPAGDKHH